MKWHYRDEVFALEAPFNGEGKSIVKTINRFNGIIWGNENMAIVYDYWWNTRNLKTYVIDPSDNSKKPKILFDRNYQDNYSDPGSFVMTRNEMGSEVLAMNKGKAYLLGDGFTEKGQFPFLDQIELSSTDKKRVYVSDIKGKKESLMEFDPKSKRLVVRYRISNRISELLFQEFEKE